MLAQVAVPPGYRRRYSWLSWIEISSDPMTTHILSLVLVAGTYLAFVLTSAVCWNRLGFAGLGSQPLDVLRGFSASLVLTAHVVKTYALFELGSPFEYEPDMYRRPPALSSGWV